MPATGAAKHSLASINQTASEASWKSISVTDVYVDTSIMGEVLGSRCGMLGGVLCTPFRNVLVGTRPTPVGLALDVACDT